MKIIKVGIVVLLLFAAASDIARASETALTLADKRINKLQQLRVTILAQMKLAEILLERTQTNVDSFFDTITSIEATIAELQSFKKDISREMLDAKTEADQKAKEDEAAAKVEETIEDPVEDKEVAEQTPEIPVIVEDPV